MKKLGVEKKKIRKILIVVVLVVIAMLLSMQLFTSPKFNAEAIEYLSAKWQTNMLLSGGAAVTSVAVSLAPNDTGTHISEMLADVSWGFMLISVVILFEKYMLLIGGNIAAVIILCIGIIYIMYIIKEDAVILKTLAKKLTIFALALLMIVPISVKLSMTIDNLDDSVQEALAISEEVKEAEMIEDKENGIWSNIWSSISEGIGSATSFIKEKIMSFFEAFVIMIVTSCIIPILILWLFIALMKLLFGIDIKLKAPKYPQFNQETTVENKKCETSNV